MTAVTSPMKVAGDALRHLRERAGLTQAELAKRVFCSQPTISEIERGMTLARPDFVALIDTAVEADGLLIKIWPVTASGGYSPELLSSLEAKAIAILDWDGRYVPGLLQTPAYMRAILRTGRLRGTPEQIEALLEKRMARQSILVPEERPTTWFVMDECVLYRPYGGRDAMREQLLSLEQAADQPSTVIQVMESASTRHPGGEGPLRIMQFQDSSPVWYTDSWYESGRLSEDKDEVSDAMTNFDMIRASAMSPEHSAEFIATVRVQRYE
jgi:transcriptional regulator with XRE-family HTH domain